MKIKIYNPYGLDNDHIINFLDTIRESQMKLLASDLLRKGIPASDIIDGVERSIKALSTIGIDPKDHFKKVYTSTKGLAINDCKMSQLGYAMLMINITPENQHIARYQYKIANLMLSNYG
jgi:hypothetical protein